MILAPFARERMLQKAALCWNSTLDPAAAVLRVNAQ